MCIASEAGVDGVVALAEAAREVDDGVAALRHLDGADGVFENGDAGLADPLPLSVG